MIAGAMSGTSADGVDAAIVQITGRGLEMSARLLSHRHCPYNPSIRHRIFTMRESGTAALSELADLARQISLVYADAVKETLKASGLTADKLSAVAAHGQTLFHAPPNTIQWLDPALIAAEVGCPVVSDFRRADCAAGGQGAPLVPFADYILFHSKSVDRIVVNIGGIANVTKLPHGAALDQVIAWDTGPGNCISDYVMRKHYPSSEGVDIDGELAGKGQVVRSLADRIRSDDFFAKAGSKSTDSPTMIRIFENALAASEKSISVNDQLATACWLTAAEIGRAVWAFGGQFSGEWILSGGGTRNKSVMRFFAENVAGQWKTTDDCGVPSQAKEAIAFALLGAATLDNVPSNVPSATGASRPVVLGSITPKP